VSSAQIPCLRIRLVRFTGRPVLQTKWMPEMVNHGFEDNAGPSRGATLHNRGNPHVDYIASVFDVVHDAGLSTALYASKDKFIIYRQSYDETTGAGTPPERAGRGKMGETRPVREASRSHRIPGLPDGARL
jgi:hypothetical protein